MTTKVSKELDQIILDIVHVAGQIPRGKTIGADYFSEAKQALTQLLLEIIGEDEQDYVLSDFDTKPQIVSRIQHRNELRQEQRATLNKEHPNE